MNIKTENFQDPRGEYSRVCPYCLQTFIATHMNRFYCPEKMAQKISAKTDRKDLLTN
jgi:hypothetical protein